VTKSDPKLNSSSLAELRDVVFETPGSSKDRKLLFRDLSLTVFRTSGLALLGPNGRGKTTILRLFLGEALPTRGTRRLCCDHRRIGYMPQNFRTGLFPWLSIRRNIALYESEDFDRGFFEEAIKSFSLGLSLNARVQTLSGGEQQLLLLCLTLARNTELLLLDEPFSAVDLSRRSRARDLVRKRISGQSLGIVFVSHDIEDAATLGQVALVLSGVESGSFRMVQNNADGRFRDDILASFRH